MKKEYLTECVQKKMSINMIAEENNCSGGTIRYWLKKYDLKTSAPAGPRTKRVEGKHFCSNCNEHLPCSDFHVRKRGGYTGHCKKCIVTKTKERLEHNYVTRKLKAIDLKGGGCEKCGYNKNYTALCFHHKDPSTKSFGIDSRNIRMRKWDLILEELDKCSLLCHNCHMEEHHPHRVL
tara:strand:- start:856 stop:1389 length:534 start_codon:yes stop_codon:yes gene_type:complete